MPDTCANNVNLLEWPILHKLLQCIQEIPEGILLSDSARTCKSLEQYILVNELNWEKKQQQPPWTTHKFPQRIPVDRI